MTRNTSRRPMRHQSTAVVAAVLAGLLGSGFVVYQSSYAAFTSTTVNAGNSFSAGSVALADNDANAAVFTVSNLKPGDSGRGCIVVAYSGSLTPAAPIQVYANAGAANTNGLANNLYFSVEQSSTSGTATTMPAGFASNAAAGSACDALTTLTPIFGGVTATSNANPTGAATLADFQAKTAYSAGGTTSVSAFTPAAQTGSNMEYRTFRFRYMLNPAAADSVQGGTANLTVNWEVRSS